MAVGSLPYILPRIEDDDLEFRKYLNFLLALMDRRRNSEFVHGYPFEITIDPSTMCQLSCPYCSVGNRTIRRERALLKPDVHERFVENLADNVFLAWYFSTGEPLLNKRFHEIVARTKGKGVFPVVSTNLSLKLSDQRIDDLLQCGLGVICVSLDGASPETYARYRVGGDFSLVVKNLKRLVRRKNELGLEYPLIEWRFLVFRHNQHEIEQARRLASEYAVDLLEFWVGYAPPNATKQEVQPAIEPVLSPQVSGPALNLARSLRGSTLRDLLRKRREFAAPPPPDHMRYQKCDWLYFGSMLFPNGSVGPCCVSNDEPDDFGLLAEGASFDHVWNNEKFRQARRMFVRDEPQTLVCSRCPQRDAQDYQFRNTLQAILRNAPDWVLGILVRDLNLFFFDVDFELSPVELGALRDGTLKIPGPFPEVSRRLEREETSSNRAREQILLLRRMLLEHGEVLA